MELFLSEIFQIFVWKSKEVNDSRFKKNEVYKNEYDMPKIEPTVNALQFSDLIRHPEHSFTVRLHQNFQK